MASLCRGQVPRGTITAFGLIRSRRPEALKSEGGGRTYQPFTSSERQKLICNDNSHNLTRSHTLTARSTHCSRNLFSSEQIIQNAYTRRSIGRLKSRTLSVWSKKNPFIDSTVFFLFCIAFCSAITNRKATRKTIREKSHFSLKFSWVTSPKNSSIWFFSSNTTAIVIKSF